MSIAETPTVTLPKFCGVGRSVVTRNIAEALDQIGLDFTVSQQRQVVVGAGVDFSIDPTDPTILHLSKPSEYNGIKYDQQAPIVRDDTLEPLAIMGAGYTILQNGDCVAILDDILAQDKDIQIIHGGIIKACEKLFVVARLGGPLQIGPDRIEKTINIMWSHTGRAKLSINFIPYLHRHGVALNMGEVDSGKHVVNIRHTKGGPARLTEARESILKAQRFYAEIEELFTRLLNGENAGFDTNDMTRYLDLLFPDPVHDDDGKRHTKGRNEKHRTAIMDIFRSQNPEINLTKWAAFTSVCQYVDEEATVKKTKSWTEPEVRLDNIWFGTGAKTKGNAFKQLLTF